jgi:hypothetical protein
LFAICRRLGLAARTASLLTLAAFIVAAPALALRPQLLGMVAFVAVAWLLVGRRTSPRTIWLVPVIVAIWANLHGSFFLGPVLVGLAWLQDLADRDPGARRTLVVALLSVLAACLTPFGPWVWAYAVGLSVNPEVTARITEWQPTTLRTVPGLLFFSSALALVALIARRGRVVPWPTLVGLGAFFLIGLYAERGLAWWAIGATPLVARLLAPAVTDKAITSRPEPATMRRLNLATAAVIVIAGIVLLPMWRPLDPGTGAPQGSLTAAPPGITDALRRLAAPGDQVFDPQAWGSWFEFALPGQLVAIDSRIELFPAEVWDDYEAVLAGTDGWQDRLTSWGVDFVVMLPADTAFESRLVEAGWTVAYRDAQGAVLAAR